MDDVSQPMEVSWPVRSFVRLSISFLLHLLHLYRLTGLTLSLASSLSGTTCSFIFLLLLVPSSSVLLVLLLLRHQEPFIWKIQAMLSLLLLLLW